MRISISQKRGLLRSAYTAARAASLPLRDKLEALSIAATAGFSSGRTVANTSGNGHSIGFSAGSNAPGPGDATDAYEDLIRLYDLVVADSTSLTTDDTRYTEMMARLVPARSSTNSYASMRAQP